MKRHRFLVALALGSALLSAAFAKDVQINPKLLTDRWPAFWITHPTAPAKGFAVLHFRRSVELAQKPEKFVIHISADNRYRLFVNGTPVSSGPARGDLLRWNFESVDISAQLHAGKNVVAAVVWNFGEYAPWAQTSLRMAFILQGDRPAESAVNTGEGWKVALDEAYQPFEDYRNYVNQFIVVGPGERVDGARYPWGWQEANFDDSRWVDVLRLDTGCPHGVGTDGAWFLHPRTLPPMEESLVRIGSIRRAEGLASSPQTFGGTTPVDIPANANVRLLLDQKHLVTAYPELIVSRGKGSQISLTYSEALFDKQMQKGNRDEIEGRRVVGYSDVFLPDGGSRRFYRPLWFRTYRYIEMDIKTAGEPLTINDFRGKFTAYPFEQNASFKSSDPSLEKVWEVGWRTARLCANETYYDCPYYEQYQYVGDTRIQALISLYVSGDDRLMRQAIQAFDDSRFAEGLTQSRYPSSSFQVIPPYSLFWIAMIHDYWMHRGDPGFVRSFFPGIQAVLDWHIKHLHPSGMLGATPWWNFVDWPDEWNWDNTKRIGGVPSQDPEGRSSILSLQLVYALQLAVELFNSEGKAYQAAGYQAVASKVRQTTAYLCWDKTRGLLADTPDKKIFSQHANALAVLVGAVSPEMQRDLMQKVAADSSLIQCTMYYRFYLYQAMKKAGLGDRYIEMLKPWRDMLGLGLTTFAERPEPTRSDCHAWSASPNYDLLASVCGIEPSSSAFRTVRIEPHLGPLQWVEGRMPHPEGMIQVKLTRKGAAGLESDISLPPGISGELIWNGKSQKLAPGTQKLVF